MRRTDKTWQRIRGLGWVLSALAIAGAAGAAAASEPLLPAIGAEALLPAFTADTPLPAGAAALAAQVLLSDDRNGMPFAVVDKQAAAILVFGADGRLAGASPVLLGRTPGDIALPGTGERTALGQLDAADMTTPAGRFVSEPGRNLSGEAVVWVDYDSAFAIHRLRPGIAKVARQQRLAANGALAKRVSAGCVVVPEAFYIEVVQRVLGQGSGVVYVLPEDGRWQGLLRGASAAL